MIICINCNTETKKKMDGLIGKKAYKDYGELLSVAVENLWIMEREISQKGAMIFGEDSHLFVNKDKPIITEKQASESFDVKRMEYPLFTPAAHEPAHIPIMFLAGGLNDVSCESVDIPPADNANGSFTLDRWLFGQYNKLLPVKANCRALAYLTSRHGNVLPLDITAAKISDAAMLLGDFLADHDRRHKIGRDDTLATAFPRSGPHAGKSLARYANQFIGSVNSQNVLSGLLWDYRLVGLTPGNGPNLLPTKQAVHLAQLTNPILDACQTEPAQKFSSEEVAFILEHIRSSVPVEAFTFRTLIRAIGDGANTPDRLDEALTDLLPIDAGRSLSPSFLTSQRSGALSRMADLGLISRVRNGVKVSYHLTQASEAFMSSADNNKVKENS